MSGVVVGIQASAESFLDEGVATVLDTVTDRALATTVFLATPTWNTASGGRAEPGYVQPDHGSGYLDENWTGGDYAQPQPELYRRTVLGAAGRAPEAGDRDVLAEVSTAAAQRGLQVYAWMDESAHARRLRTMPGFGALLEVDMWNKPARRPCYRNPEYRAWVLATATSYLSSYPVDGLGWTTDRIGPLNLLLQGPAKQGLGLMSCYCRWCLAEAERRGIDWRRAQEGYRKMVLLNARVAQGDLPNDGAFVTYWRLLLIYPELLAWQTMWTDGQHQVYRDIFGSVKAYRPEVEVGWTIDQAATINPFFRASQDLADLSHICDFLKVDVFTRAGGPRLHSQLDDVSRGVFGDGGIEETYPVLAQMMGLPIDDYDALPVTGLPAAHVERETKRAVVGNEGRCAIYTGLDVDVPAGLPRPGEALTRVPGDHTEADAGRLSGPDLAPSTPAMIRAAVRAAFAGGAGGIVLSRKYAEMRLTALDAVGAELRSLGITA